MATKNLKTEILRSALGGTQDDNVGEFYGTGN